MSDNEDTIKQSEKKERAIKEILKKINKITESCAGCSFIFRGESEKHEKISSGLYRHYCMSQFSKPVYFPAREMTREIIDSAREHFEEGKSDIGILTGLQHQGDKTTLIDFTRSVYIALYFACNKHLNEDGWLFMIEEEKTEILDKDSFKETLKRFSNDKFSEMLEENLHKNESSENLKSVSKDGFDPCVSASVNQTTDDGENKGNEIYRVNPIGKDPRVVFQSSVFVFPVRGFLKEKEDELCVIKIKKELKKDILECLSKYNGIEEKTIYNDLQGFIQRSPSDQYMYFYQAMVFYKEKDYERAIKCYNQAIEINSKYFEAYFNRGKAKSASGKYDKAIQDYSQALRINSKYFEAYFNRGKAKSALDKYDEAIKDYSQALRINPEDADAYFNRGKAKSALDEYDEAIKDYSQALRIKPEHAGAYFNRGNSKFALGVRHESQTHYEDAIKDYDQSLKFNPEYIWTYIKRAIANDKCDKRPEAIEDFKQALRLSRQQGDEEMEIAKKIEVLLRALEGNPKNSPTDQ